MGAGRFRTSRLSFGPKAVTKNVMVSVFFRERTQSIRRLSLYTLVITVGFLTGDPLTAQESHGTASGHGESAHMAAKDFDDKAALALSQSAIGAGTGDYRFTDRSGKPVNLADFKGKPLVISLIYTSCAHACPVTTRTLAETADVAFDALGEDSFSIVSIGFDTKIDTPERMRQFAGRMRIKNPNWHFLTTDAETVRALSQDIGFLFFKSPKGFDHLAQTTILDAEGNVYRQVYGENFETPHLVDPLKNLDFGTETPFASLDDMINKIKLFCTVYDPMTDRYRFDYSLFIGMFVGMAVIMMLIHILFRAWRRTATSRKNP